MSADWLCERWDHAESFRVIYGSYREHPWGPGMGRLRAAHNAFALVFLRGWPNYRPWAFWRRR